MLAVTLLNTEVTGFVIAVLFVALFVVPLIPDVDDFVSRRSAGLDPRLLREDAGRSQPAQTRAPAANGPPEVHVTTAGLQAHLKAAEVATGQPLQPGGWDVLVPGYPCIVLLVVSQVGCRRVFLQSLRPTSASLRAQ